jgi:hypothetical protein
MATPSDVVKTRKKKVLSSGKFYAAPVAVGDKYITVRLPLKVAEYFQLDKPEIYWTPINGVIQLSSGEPHMVIPAMNISADKFIPQA